MLLEHKDRNFFSLESVVEYEYLCFSGLDRGTV